MSKEQENLRQEFIDETKAKLWAEDVNEDVGFSDKYVEWLEAKQLNLTDCCETLPCSYAEGYNDAIAKIKEEAKYIKNENKLGMCNCCGDNNCHDDFCKG